VFVVTGKDLTADEMQLLKKEAAALFRKSGSWKEELLLQLDKALKISDRASLAGQV
jgi:hypothetical protein